jgi:epoxyqueuosine reductase
VSFASEVKEPAFAAREFIAGKDARTLAEDLLAMSQEEFSAAFRKSPMKRAKLAGLKRNAAVVSRDIGTSGDFDAPTGASDNREPSTD